MARRRKSRIGKTGCLFWLFILLVLVVIFVYRGKGSFKETFSFLKEKVTPEQSETLVQPEKPPAEKTETSPEVREEPSKEDEKPEEKIIIIEESGEPEPTPEEKVSEKPKTEEKAKPPKPEVKSLTASLYYVKINEDDGTAQLYPVRRTVEYRDSPLTRTIENLLIGPTDSEKKAGTISFIPEETRLIWARIDEGHLTLNFSSGFENNYSGREAILFQLSQVMFTAFDFQQVKKLSILIDGKRKQYITGEGIPIKEAYTRQDLVL